LGRSGECRVLEHNDQNPEGEVEGVEYPWVNRVNPQNIHMEQRHPHGDDDQYFLEYPSQLAAGFFVGLLFPCWLGHKLLSSQASLGKMSVG